MEIKRICANCKHTEAHYNEEPCISCNGFQNWKAKDAKPVAGFDPGAPEGDKTNVRLDWGERGPELIGPQDITSMDHLKDGHLVETARDVVKQITRLDYAIAGVRSKIASIGIKFTDKELIRDEIGFLIAQLNALQVDLFELEEERERKLRGAADVEFKDRNP